MTTNFQGVPTSLRRCFSGRHRLHDRMWNRRKSALTRTATSTTTTTPQRRTKIAVAMSGGVDSSVAAYVLQQQQQQHDLIGLHMSNWNPLDEDFEEDANKRKCHEQDSQDTQKVCDFLKIPFHHANFVAEYWTDVFEPFVEQISLKGQMPNPDVGCNSKIKFGKMKEYALEKLQVDAIATGHYARLWYNTPKENPSWLVQPHLEDEMKKIIEESLEDSNSSLEWLLSQDNTPLLIAGADVDKDQSYFLSGVRSNAFRNVIFPLGQFHKTNKTDNNDDSDDTKPSFVDNKLQTVRDIAKEAKLPTATKKESMGICFVGKRNFGHFISQYLPSYEPEDESSSSSSTTTKSGTFVDIDTGCIVGHHDGLPYYTLTLGQGAKIGGASQKWFVAGRRQPPQVENTPIQDTTIFVCNHTHHPSLYADELYIPNFNWILSNGLPPKPLLQHGRMRALCRTRHLQPLVPCQVILGGGTTSNALGSSTTITLKFDRPLRAITPGQMAVVYVGGKGLVCLGGGPISNHGPTYHEKGQDLPRDLHPSGQNDLSLEKRRQLLP